MTSVEPMIERTREPVTGEDLHAPTTFSGRVGLWAVRRRRRVLWGTLLVMVVAGAIAAGTLSQLQLARFQAPGSESMQAAERLADLGGGASNVSVLVTAPDGVDDPASAAAALEVQEELAATEGVADVFSYWSTDEWSTLSSSDGSQALILARLTGDATQARERLAEVSEELTGAHGPVSVEFGGSEEVFRQVAEQARADFAISEVIILPGVFLLLLLVLRRPAGALMTLGLGLISVVGSLALLRGMAALTDVSTFAANLVLVMGVALGVDYGLFVIARYRESREAGQSQRQAAVTGAAKAGHTVLVSAAAVCAALVALLIFPFAFLRSFTYAGVAVVACAALAALVVLPAMLGAWGHRVERRTPPKVEPAEGGYARMARRVMRRPVAWLLAGTAFLLALGAPALGLTVGPPDDRILPAETSSRVTQDKIRAGFDAEVADLLTVAPAGDAEWSAAEVSAYTAAIEEVPGVVEALPPSERGLETPAPIVVVPSAEALSGASYALVDDVRAVAAPSAALVGGSPAELADFRDSMVERLPWVVVTMIVLSTLVLVAATRTILLPLKAAVLNLLSMTVLLGALVFVFQDGNLAGLFGVTATGSLDLSIPVLMVCVAFGLSMDYEVIMLSRIIEEHDAGADLETAVATGIQRSAPLVTAAAGILAASFLVYLSSSLVYLLMLGIGMTLVVIVDATIIRTIMLPAAMKLMGSANWWWFGQPRRTAQRE